MAKGKNWKFLFLPVVLVPIPILLKASGGPDLVVFAAAGVAVIPLAHLMGVATEELGKRTGPGIGGFLNATLGNATELIIALVALARAASLAAGGNTQDADGLVEVVKASITGSIIDGGASLDCVGGTSGGYNVISDNTCGTATTGDLKSTDALLGPLAANGGPTATHLPGIGSPARDSIPAGTLGLCDGSVRPINVTIDNDNLGRLANRDDGLAINLE